MKLNIVKSNEDFLPATINHILGTYEDIQSIVNSDYLHTITPFGEDRKALWANTYLKDEKEVFHLGVDIQVPAGTEVISPVDGVIAHVFTDNTELGWGTRVDIVDLNHHLYWILGHLGNINCKPGDTLNPGSLIGWVGDHSNNGKCFEHLHVQVTQISTILQLQREDIGLIDGYGSKSYLQHWIDPLQYIQVIDNQALI